MGSSAPSSQAVASRLVAHSGASIFVANAHPLRSRPCLRRSAGIYNFSGTFYLLGEHYRDCPHAGKNKTADPLAVGNCEMCGHIGTTFALYTSTDLEAWTLNTTDVIPTKPGVSARAQSAGGLWCLGLSF